MKIKIPANCKLEVTHCDKDGKEKYITVSNKDKSNWILYKVNDNGSLEKISTSKNPKVFEEKYNLYE